MKIEETLDKFDKKLDDIFDMIKNNNNDINTIKDDLYHNNGKKCLFTRVLSVEEEQGKVNNKITLATGFLVCLSYFFNKIFK